MGMLATVAPYFSPLAKSNLESFQLVKQFREKSHFSYLTRRNYIIGLEFLATV